MASWMLPLFYSLIFLQSSSSSYAKFQPSYFPSWIIRPKTSSLSSNNELYKTKYFTQILDHFNYNPQSYQTFQQRYLINDTFWGGPKTNAPIFVYTGNEGNIEWFAQNTGFMYDIAPEFKALLLFIEHRYYGKSIPYGGDKKKAYKNSKNLGYLSSTQALADYATLIIDHKYNLTSTDSPVIVFGGSYGGMLAAWFRLKYPHVAIGALASSSPILQFENITSQYSFNNIITQDFRSESENCYQVIKGSWKRIKDTAMSQAGLELLRKSFRICKNYISGDYIEEWLSTAFIYTSMTDYPTPSNFLAPMPAYPIKQMCKAIDNPNFGNDTFAKLYHAANVYYNYTGDVSCFDLIDNSDPHDLGGWQWQSESENCYKVIKGSWKRIKDTAKSQAGLELLRKSFRICKNYISGDYIEEWLSTAFIYTSMTDYPTPSNFLAPMPAYPIKQMCKAIDNPSFGNDTFAKLYHAANVYYNYTGDVSCFDLIDNSDPHDLGGWQWQACTEMVMPTNGNNEESIFPASTNSYEAHVQYCQDAYKVQPRPNWITTEFGGHDISRVLKRFGSNIIFFNGLRDPWSGGGVLKNISKSIIAIVEKEGAHHVDLRFSTSKDPKWLQDVRNREIGIMKDWISEYYHTLADSDTH